MKVFVHLLGVVVALNSPRSSLQVSEYVFFLMYSVVCWN